MNKQASITIAIIGSHGRMGSMLSEQLSQQGFIIKGIDCEGHDSGDLGSTGSTGSIGATDTCIAANATMAETIASCQVVLLCVPVGALASLLEQMAPMLLPQQLLMDITSVKCLPMKLMEKNFSGAVVGAHPLFGPNPLPADKRTILVRGKNASDDHCRLAERIFESIQSHVHWATAEEHDRGVAIAQTLNFTVSAAFFSTLANEHNIGHFLTPSFKRHLEAARKHLTEDTAMFLEFSAMNPFFGTAIAAYESTLARIAEGELPAVAKEAQQWYARNDHS